MSLQTFTEILHRTIGLDAVSIGLSAIDRAVQQRRIATEVPDTDAYLRLVQSSPAELQEFVEEVVVPETWFFRDREAFAALTRLAALEMRPAGADGIFRVLSLPCSTGEEPYSIAMALLDAGIPGSLFRVNAVDVSHRSLERARRGVYGRNSFRGADLHFRERHFSSDGSGWRLDEATRAPVRFHHGNLFEAGLPVANEVHDVIFCRNLLIYFDRATQDNAMALLSRMLSPAGVIFVGPSETGLLMSHDFTSLRIPLAFGFRRPSPRSAESAATVPMAAAPGARPRPPARAPVPPPRPRAAVPPARMIPPADETRADKLAEATHLADLGRLADAAKLCEEHLRAAGPAAQAYYLLGLVRDAAGRHAEAAGHYRRALYLEPRHVEALTHLALLLESQDDPAAARVLRERARRAANAADAGRARHTVSGQGGPRTQ